MLTRTHHSFTIDTPEESGTVSVEAKLSRTYSVNGRISGFLLSGKLKTPAGTVRIHKTVRGMRDAYAELDSLYTERARRLGVA